MLHFVAFRSSFWAGDPIGNGFDAAWKPRFRGHSASLQAFRARGTDRKTREGAVVLGPWGPDSSKSR